MREVNPRNAAVLVPFAEKVLVVKQTELLDDVVHYQVSIDGWLVTNDFLVGVAELHYLLDIEPLIRIELEHARDHAAKLRAVFLA